MPIRGRLFTAMMLSQILGGAGCESLRGPATPPERDSSAVATATPTPTAKRPAKHWLRVGQYVIHSDTPLNANDPVFRDLADLPEQIQNELELPAGDSIVQVFLFDSSEKYEEFMKSKYPRLPKRRAYFFAEHRLGGGGDDLLVFTWPSEHLAKDLRHELTHATLHSILKGVPLWLDEGLAGFFELPRATQGVNASHLDILRRGPFMPDLARLEKLGQVQQMETAEYREAWAWIHFLLRGDPAGRKVLLEYMQQLRTNPTPSPLQPKLCEALTNPNQSLAEHLTKTEYPAISAANR